MVKRICLEGEKMERMIQYEVTVKAPRWQVWDAWTSVKGVRAFFAPDAVIDLRIGGAYEIYFDPQDSVGQRGSEGCRILSYLPEEMLSFSWNAPPQFMAVRSSDNPTWVVVQIERLSEGSTRTRLTHLGWKAGEDWDAVYQYFSNAWKTVLRRLAERFETGPIQWDQL
jgi:uncharacterized protein YndB with AHSA1/START domain